MRTVALTSYATGMVCAIGDAFLGETIDDAFERVVFKGIQMKHPANVVGDGVVDFDHAAAVRSNVLVTVACFAWEETGHDQIAAPIGNR